MGPLLLKSRSSDYPTQPLSSVTSFLSTTLIACFFKKLLILLSASRHQMLPALSDLSMTGKSTTRSLLQYFYQTWLKKIICLDYEANKYCPNQWWTAFVLFSILALVGKKQPKLLSKNSTSVTAGMTNYNHPIWGRKKKKWIVCLSLWKRGSVLHFLPFLLVKQTKRKGGKGNGSTSNGGASEIQSWKDVPTDERQWEEAAQFLLHCTR